MKAFQMEYDPHLEEDQLEKQQTKEILETELTKVNSISMNGQWQYFTEILTQFVLIPHKVRVHASSVQFHCKMCKTPVWE